MTLHKLAQILVDEYFDGSPGERYQNAIEREIKSLKAQAVRDSEGVLSVTINLED